MTEHSETTFAGQDPIFRNPRFDALRSALYHTERRNFLDRLNKTINSLVILLSAGVVGKAAGHFSLDSLWLELSVLIVATIQLVFDFGASAKNHEFLQKRYYEALAEMEAAPHWNEDFEKKWSGKLLNLCAEETLTLRALDAIAYNKALGAIFDDPAVLNRYQLHVGIFHSFFRNMLAFNWTEFRLKSDLKRWSLRSLISSGPAASRPLDDRPKA